MEKSKVYFTDLHTSYNDPLQKKLERLMHHAGFENIDFSGRFAAVKIHFGEPGNLAYLRPNLAKTVADYIKKLGGKPFLTDCNTLYTGRRKNALEHIDTAYENGFNPFCTGCHVIIADGLKGNDEALVPIDGDYVKEAKIGRALYDADIIISLNHFKGHQAAGFGGAFKNIGMGGGSRAGKMEMHYEGKPKIMTELCRGCGSCVKVCAQSAIAVSDKKAAIDYNKCVGCGKCLAICNFDAIVPDGNLGSKMLNYKIAEYTEAIIRDKPNFHISFVMDVSPNCDCNPNNDIPIVPDVGIFASFDPVALDQACVDAVNAQPIEAASIIGAHAHDGEQHDRFMLAHPDTDWRCCLEHAEKRGMGSRRYEIINVK